MDSIQMNKFQAINNYKKQRLLNKLMLYSSTALTCILFLSSPLWYPLLLASLKFLVFEFLPKIGALLFSSKCIFIVGNLIIIILVGESKISKSRSSSLASNVKVMKYAEQEKEEKDHQKSFIFLDGESKIVSGSRTTSILPQEEEFQEYFVKEEVQKSYNLENVKDGNCTGECNGNKEDQIFAVPNNELNKRADDFIARVNKQIRLEAVTIV